MGLLHRPLPFRAQKTMWKRKWKDCKSQKEWITPRKQHLPGTPGLTHIGIHEDCGCMHRSKPAEVPTPRGRSDRHVLPSLTNKLSQIDIHSFLQWRLVHWVYKQVRVGPMLSSRWPTQNKVHSILGKFFVSYCFVWYFYWTLLVFCLYTMVYDFVLLWYVCVYTCMQFLYSFFLFVYSALFPYLSTYFIKKKKEIKRCGVEKVGGSGRRWGKGNYN